MAWTYFEYAIQDTEGDASEPEPVGRLVDSFCRVRLEGNEADCVRPDKCIVGQEAKVTQLTTNGGDLLLDLASRLRGP